MDELWIEHFSVRSWQEPHYWIDYLQHAEGLIGCPLTHLDTRDPVRRKVVSLQESADLICSFGPQDTSRWLFGKFRKAGITFLIRHFRRPGQDHRYNELTWHVPRTFVANPGQWDRIRNLFHLGNQSLIAFHGYADDCGIFKEIKSRKRTFGAVDIEAELPGIFWLTYFSRPYVAFFGEEKLAALPNAERAGRGGVTLTLAERPELVPDEMRGRLAGILGSKSFVNFDDVIGKLPGRCALSFEQLRAYEERERGPN